jgi:hypothetical protein
MSTLSDYLDDERGETSMVLRLVLAVTISAAVIIILLQLMHTNLETIKRSSGDISSGAKTGLEETMKTLSD